MVIMEIENFFKKISLLYFLSDMLPFHKFNAPLKNHPKQSTSSVFSVVRCDAIELIWALKDCALQ